MSVINQNLLLTPEGYQISRSVRLRSSASGYFNRTPAGAGSRTTFTWSHWCKVGTLDVRRAFVIGNTNTNANYLEFDSSNRLSFVGNDGTSPVWIKTTSQVFRDPSAWYHIVAVFDSTNATAADRVRLYVNGDRVTAFASSTDPTLNYNTFFNQAVQHDLGRIGTAGFYFDGYLTEVNFVDGQALTPSSFGETDAVTGVWKPKKYAGTYGTNGFYLNFSDNSAATAAAIGKDSSGNGNNWTPNNISVTAGVTYDSMLDVPTMWADGGNGRGNYCTLNPLDWNTTAFTLSNGNLTWTSTTTANGSTRGTMGMTTGKWYWEVTATSVGSGTAGVGIAKDGSTQFGSGQALYGSNLGNKYIDGVNTSYGATWATNNVIGVAYDADAGQITFYKDNVSQGAITLSGYAGVNVCPAVADGSSLGFTLNANFGQRPFAYTPPTGFKALNTQNLPEATIKKGNQYFDVVTRTGTGSSDGVSQVISSLAFTPDLVWNKARSNAFNHNLVDSARGNDAILFSNLTNAETSLGTTGTQLQLTTNGFTAIQRVSHQATNQNGVTYADWCWKESASAGFDIVTYTGDSNASRTVSHGLGVTPSLVIIKNRTTARSWAVRHSALAAGNNLYLESTSASTAVSGTLYGGVGALTSTTFGFLAGSANASNVNSSANNYVAYLFAEVAGFSKFGRYTGNGSTDGPFVYLGFRPKFVMVKRTDAVSSWNMFDSGRSINNVTGNLLNANLSDVEYTQPPYMDFLSNGFKVRTNDAGQTAGNENQNGATYIYAAFAENPFKNSLAR